MKGGADVAGQVTVTRLCPLGTQERRRQVSSQARLDHQSARRGVVVVRVVMVVRVVVLVRGGRGRRALRGRGRGLRVRGGGGVGAWRWWWCRRSRCCWCCSARRAVRLRRCCRYARRRRLGWRAGRRRGRRRRMARAVVPMVVTLATSSCSSSSRCCRRRGRGTRRLPWHWRHCDDSRGRHWGKRGRQNGGRRARAQRVKTWCLRRKRGVCRRDCPLSLARAFSWLRLRPKRRDARVVRLGKIALVVV